MGQTQQNVAGGPQTSIFEAQKKKKKKAGANMETGGNSKGNPSPDRFLVVSFHVKTVVRGSVRTQRAHCWAFTSP